MRLPDLFRDVCLGAIPVLGIAWLMDVPLHLGQAVMVPTYISGIAGLAIAAGFLVKPYGARAGWLEVVLGLAAIACWAWGGWNHEAWLTDIANRGPEKWAPGVVGIGLMVEAMRRNCGLAITILVSVFIAYGFLGHWLPGAFEAAETSPRLMVLYLYSDTNAIPGLVLRVGSTIVLAFILMGKVMEISGASRFFTDSAMAGMGHRRGGPAKVAIVASSIFGTVNGTTVGNIMSTGVVTIPLMKRFGFSSRYAAAIEAVASNGGQLAPPVMGTTAFLIAEFLQIDYAEVALAALLPAFIYYAVIFIQVDRYAERSGLTGVPRSELPKWRPTLAMGWIFLGPLALLLYLLFWLGYNPGKSALYTAALMLVLGLIRAHRAPDRAYLADLVIGGARNLVPLLLVCGGAGIVIGVLNKTGLAFSMVLILQQIAEQAGLFAMLVVTAVIAVVLGMGMPTAAVYIVLSVILAPALVKMGIVPLAAHMFIFYFGLLSMLTPPVAIASFVAASLAGSDMWRTGVTGLKLAASAYLLPFLMVYNPALVLQGTWLEIVYAAVTAVAGGWLLAYAVEGAGGAGAAARQIFLERPALFAASIAVGGSTLWFGADNPLALLPAIAAIAIKLLLHFRFRIQAKPGVKT